MNRITLALGVALAALVAAAPVAARPSTAAATTVKVTMKEFKFTLSKTSVKHGAVTFTLVNKGKLHLRVGSVYVVKLASGIRDRAGNRLAKTIVTITVASRRQLVTRVHVLRQ